MRSTHHVQFGIRAMRVEDLRQQAVFWETCVYQDVTQLVLNKQ